jgi:acyl dehydratase
MDALPSVLVIFTAAIGLLVASLVSLISNGRAVFVKDGKKKILKGNLPSQPYIFYMAIKKSLFGKKTKSTKLPDVQLVQKSITLDETNLSKYRKICGFTADNEVPITYNYLTIFPLQALLLVDSAFPFQAMGLVHLANRIQQFKEMKAADKVTAVVKFDQNVVPHEKGYCFTVVSELFDDASDVLLWRSESTYLFRTKASKGAEGKLYESTVKPEDMNGVEKRHQWDIPGDFSRKYASVSGDYNPIHLYGITAKLFGFPHGCIMHGMWSIAACSAVIMPVITQDAASAKSSTGGALAEIYVELKLPMYVPATPTLFCTEASVKKSSSHTSSTFEVSVNKKGKKGDIVPHLRGKCSGLAKK